MLNTPWRNTATAIYAPSKDGRVYGAMDIDVTEIMAHIASNRKSGVKITMTHVMAKVLSDVFLNALPYLNTFIKRGTLYERDTVIAGVSVLLDASGELALAKLENAHKMDFPTLVMELKNQRSALINGKQDKTVQSKNLLASIPWPFRVWLYKSANFVANTLGIDLPMFNLTPNSFGSFILSNLGSLGLNEGFAALMPPANIPIVFTMGKVEERPVVRNGEIVVRTMMKLGATLDHRIVDGFQASQMMKHINKKIKALADSGF